MPRDALSFLRPWHHKIYGFGTLFFGMAGSHNDINVLQRSPVFDRLADNNDLVVHYEINDHPYNTCYYFPNGIYPEWSTFVKTICEPTKEKNRRFAKQQEACKKDVEHAFGALQSRWAIVWHPARIWIIEVMTTCVVMHNMIVENESDEGLHDQGWEFQGELVAPHPGAATLEEFLHVQQEIHDCTIHDQL
jgi:hypothetical protein